MAPLLLVGLLLADVAPFPREPESACVQDSDCVISTSAGCCACCPAQPFATSKQEAQRQLSRCAVVDCSGHCNQKCRGVNPAEFKAVCSSGQCVAQRLEPEAPAQECRADSDCMAVVSQPPANAACHASACGCCPVQVAAPVKSVPLTPRQPAPPKSEERPKSPSPYGLSTGQPAPNCSPCPSPAPRAPLCSGGKCVLSPVPRPHPVG